MERKKKTRKKDDINLNINPKSDDSYNIDDYDTYLNIYEQNHDINNDSCCNNCKEDHDLLKDRVEKIESKVFNGELRELYIKVNLIEENLKNVKNALNNLENKIEKIQNLILNIARFVIGSIITGFISFVIFILTKLFNS